MEKVNIWVQNLRYIDLIRILGLLKSFAFVMQSKSGAFFQKGIKQANKKLFKPYRVSKKWKKDLILVQKLRFIDMIRILGLLKSFDFVMWSKCGAFFLKKRDRTS